MEKEIREPWQEVSDILGHLQVHLQDWQESGLDVPRPVAKTVAPLIKKPADPEAEAGSLAELEKQMQNCTLCRLHQGRTRLVFGEGSAQAELIFVGEGPGREDDQQGRPFTGEAGELLTKIIRAMGLERRQVYLCHAVKCRSTEHRDPEADEIACCLPFLKKQLACIKPRIICTLGRIAGQALLGESFQLAEQRGRWLAYDEIPLLPTYHPAYLLRKPSAKRQVWEDIQKIMKHLGLEVKKNV
ncbi:MAG: uracil-DNA glycosylase [Desulfobacteraceae bacterium]|nr:MAG: uracil-DNA glycosylase [Desulfobacteraceae bacterium]